jgi:hypothetical protein
MPAEVKERYGWMMRAARVRVGQGTKHGTDPRDVAKIVEKALLAAKPKTRYLIGKDARVVGILSLLPDRLRQKLILGQLRKMAAAYKER